MGYNSGDEPKAEQTFLERIRHALDLKAGQFSKATGIGWPAYLTLSAKNAPDQDEDDNWWKVKEYVDLRLAQLMAAKAELDKHLQNSRVKRAGRQERVRRGRLDPPTRE